MSQQKILLLVPDLRGMGGVANYYRVLNLSESDRIEHFFVNTPGRQGAFATFFRLVVNYLKFINLLRQRQYKLIHLNPSLNRKSFFRDAGFLILTKLFRKQTLVFFRGWEDKFEDQIKDSGFLSLLFKRSFAKADKLVVLGEVFKRKLIAMNVGREKEFFIETTVADSNYIDQFDLQQKLDNFAEGNITFLFLSRILKEKGIYIAIDTFEELKPLFPTRSFKFFIAGDGPELDAVKNYVSTKQIDGIEFTGHVGGEEKHRLLTESHLMLFPTFHGEGLPNCILEAMLYGMPIISRINAAIPDVVKNNHNGFLTESLSSTHFIEMTQRIITDEDLFEKMARENHKYALSHFTSEVIKQRIIKIYDSFE